MKLIRRTGSTVPTTMRSDAFRVALVLLLTMVAFLTVASCAGGSFQAVRGTATAPTPTPTPPSPQALLTAAAAQTETIRSMRFEVSHSAGSIFVDSISAKIVDVEGVWDAEQGAEFIIGGYLVSGPAADVADGIFAQMKMVVTPDSYYLVDPVSRTWTKQPYQMIPIEVEQLAGIMAEIIRGIENPRLRSDAEVDGVWAYRIEGNAPTSVMQWTMLDVAGQPDVRVTIWISKGDLMPIKASITGPVSEYDAEDTVRELVISEINAPHAINTPKNYIDVSGG